MIRLLEIEAVEARVGNTFVEGEEAAAELRHIEGAAGPVPACASALARMEHEHPDR
ncbi:MAG: hypothetical protein ACM3SS_07415 [Rhodospirillaceae bacterium]